METITVSEAKASLSKLLERVLDGEAIAIGRRGKPEVVLTRYRTADGGPRPLGDYNGAYRLDEEFFEADAEVADLFESGA